MGALHGGHLSLVERARCENDAVIVTIFVNPTQFAPGEDLASYPRDLARDLTMLRDVKADLVFTPTPEIIYPTDFQTFVEVTGVSQGLEGVHRPNHFRGVVTVVAKLFNLTQPDRAYFGQKDAQQVAVIRQMVRDLNFPLELVVCPTVREPDGLALSSRNAYLTPEQRQAAPVLYRALSAARDAYIAGERQPKRLRQMMLAVLHSEPLAALEYVSVADAESMKEMDATITRPALLSMAVRFGKTRLIDNLQLSLEN
jgi:pantoate--beta-alanine ligase